MKIYLLSAFIVIITIAGCSGGSSPISPQNVPNGDQSIAVIDVSESGHLINGIGILGTYELSLNSELKSVELIATRASTIGESYIVSGAGFFTIAPCSSCLKIKSIALTSDNNIALTFAIRHPFKPGDPFKPPTAVNRLDLDVFDTALLVHPVGATPEVYPLTGATAYAGFIANSAGYTTELANLIGDPAALPYVLVIDDNEAGADSFNEFPMGAEAEFNAIFKLDSRLDFDLYLTMGYGASARKSERLNPTYYNPEFNRKSAWKVIVTPPNGNDPPAMGNTWNNSDTTTPFTVTASVFDWQVGHNVDPGLTNPDDIYAASDVANVSLEIPGMHNSIVEKSVADSGSGAPNDPLVYTLSVANENSLNVGEYYGLVKVTDERVPLTPADFRDYLIHTTNGVILENYEMPEYATYQVFIATVVTGCGPITGQIITPSCPVTGLSDGVTVDFTVSASSANGGDPITLYEVDFEYDGTVFTADDTSTDGVFDDVGPFTVPIPCPSNIPKTFNVAFRATDSCNPQNVTIFAECSVTVNSCMGSVGHVWITVNRIPEYWASPLPPFTTYHQGDKFDPAGAWTLNWNSVADVAEYAIYYDNNPGNYNLPGWSQSELTDSLTLLGTSATNSYTVPGSHLPTNHYVIGNTYIVKARAVLGDPGSETANSEPAFIMTFGWETAPSNSPILDPNLFEGWQAGWETSVSPGTWYQFPTTHIDQQNVLEGAKTARISSYLIGNMSNVGRWTALVHRTPTVPSASVRFIDAALQPWTANDTSPSIGGVIIGTCSIMPGHPWATPVDFEWARAESSPPYKGYMNIQDVFLRTVFDDVDTSQPWCWQAYNFYTYPDCGWRIGGDVNATGNPNDPFVGYASAKNPYSLMNENNWFSDDIAIMIY